MENNNDIKTQRVSSLGRSQSTTTGGQTPIPTSGFHSNETPGAKRALAYIDQGMTFEELDESKLVDDASYVGALIEALNVRRDISAVSSKSVGRGLYMLSCEAKAIDARKGPLMDFGRRRAAIKKEHAFLLAVYMHMPVLSFRLTLETGDVFVKIAEEVGLEYEPEPTPEQPEVVLTMQKKLRRT